MNAGLSVRPSDYAALAGVLDSLIAPAAAETDALLQRCFSRQFRRRSLLRTQGLPADEIFFVVEGALRVMVTDLQGTVHTTHFAFENQFIADYTSFLTRQPAQYSLEALEDTAVVVMPREAIEWGYQALPQGEKLGRLIAEYYFIYLDNRVIHSFTQTPVQRYEMMQRIFPDIHNRVPQHMIASYLGITPVHLSRLKRGAAKS